MNLPMRNDKNVKTIYGKSNGINIPPRVKKLLIGAEVIWLDKDPLSQDMDDQLNFFFGSHTSSATDMLLRRHGMTDVSQYVNIKFKWGVQMELYYSMPNRQEVDKRHMEPFYFEFHGTIYPMHEKFKEMRDLHYMTKQLEFGCVPDDHKNKKFYETTKFRAVVVNV